MSLGMMAPRSRANVMHRPTYFQDVTVEVADGQTLLDVSIRNRIRTEM
jgi:hypothetical protein